MSCFASPSWDVDFSSEKLNKQLFGNVRKKKSQDGKKKLVAGKQPKSALQRKQNQLKSKVKKLNSKNQHLIPPSLVIADFGCGDARLSRLLPNVVHSFDVVGLTEDVTVCDMAHTPLPSDSVDVAVFCLSLMGTNLVDYIMEANRVLKQDGILKIAEVESRFDNIDNFINHLQKFGFTKLHKDVSHDLFCFMDFKKKSVPAVELNTTSALANYATEAGPNK
uniref:Ribosomal RNA-processing protein 8 n=1 Tax=Timema douglasi TaxID=61478 RepID=A0A7R8VGM2_TIMDO|nr:unnamed protein product [Timema douglasi]